MVLRLPLLAALWASASAFMVVNQQRRPPFRLHASVEEKASSKLGKPGTAMMDVPWQDLGFELRRYKQQCSHDLQGWRMGRNGTCQGESRTTFLTCFMSKLVTNNGAGFSRNRL